MTPKDVQTVIFKYLCYFHLIVAESKGNCPSALKINIIKVFINLKLLPKPMIMADQSETKPQPGVIATNPQTAPQQKP